MIRIFKNANFSISKLDDRIYYASLTESEKVSLEDVIQFNDSMDAIIQNEAHVAIMDITGAINVIAEARLSSRK